MNESMRKVFVETILIVLIAAVLAAAGYTLRPGKFNPWADGTAPLEAEQDGPVKVISIEEAQEMFSDSTALFADARPAVAFDEGHIQGAMHLPPASFDQWAADILDYYPMDQPIIAYCEGPQCALSHELAEKLTWLGFEKVYYLIDGWGQWKARGLPVD